MHLYFGILFRNNCGSLRRLHRSALLLILLYLPCPRISFTLNSKLFSLNNFLLSLVYTNSCRLSGPLTLLTVFISQSFSPCRSFPHRSSTPVSVNKPPSVIAAWQALCKHSKSPHWSSLTMISGAIIIIIFLRAGWCCPIGVVRIPCWLRHVISAGEFRFYVSRTASFPSDAPRRRSLSKLGAVVGRRYSTRAFIHVTALVWIRTLTWQRIGRCTSEAEPFLSRFALSLTAPVSGSNVKRFVTPARVSSRRFDFSVASPITASTVPLSRWLYSFVRACNASVTLGVIKDNLCCPSRWCRYGYRGLRLMWNRRATASTLGISCLSHGTPTKVCVREKWRRV